MCNRNNRWFGVVGLALLALSPVSSCGGHAAGDDAEHPRERAGDVFVRQPLAFVPNRGQWDHPARYVGAVGTTTVLLEDRGWMVVAQDVPRAEPRRDPRRQLRGPEVETDPSRRGFAVRMTFEGAAAAPALRAERRLPGVCSYFLDDDADRWRADVPRFASVVYDGMYEGVDVRVRDGGGHAEYDLIVTPGFDLASIRVKVEGADALRIRDDGALVIDTVLGPLVQPPPKTWMTSDLGEHEEVACHYVLWGRDRFGFEAPAWPSTMPLTIDPGLVWSTFLGGQSTENVQGLHVDDAGIITVVGVTNSSDFPTTPGAISLSGGRAYISRFDPSRRSSEALVYSAILGSGGNLGVSVDDVGVMTVFGRTTVRQFPTTAGAYQRSHQGLQEVYVARVDPRLQGSNQLVYSTFLGGAQNDWPNAFCVDAQGLVTVVGTTHSGDYPTTQGAYQRSFGVCCTAFITQLDPSRPRQEQLVYSTFLGAGIDGAFGVAQFSNSTIAIVGNTRLAGFPTTPTAFSRSYGGGFADAVISVLDPSMPATSQLVYSTLFGGDCLDWAEDVAIGFDDVLTVVGRTCSEDLPTTPKSYDRSFNDGLVDGFVIRLDLSVAGSAQLVYSTYIGGGNDDVAARVALGAGNVITIEGWTLSADWPTTTGAFDTSYNGDFDTFAARLDPARSGPDQLVYSTFLGGGLEEFGAINGHLDERGFLTLAGRTESSDFPTTSGAYERRLSGFNDGYVAVLDMLPSGVSAYGASTPGCGGPLGIGVLSWPQAGISDFTLTCNNAPPSSLGVVLLGGAPLAAPLSFLGTDLWVNPGGPWLLVLPVASDARGVGDLPLPLPGNSAGARLFAQFAWAGPTGPAPCPVSGVSASNALEIVVQP